MSRTHTLLRTAQVLLVGAFLFCSQVQAATPAIGGYSPVSYFTKETLKKTSRFWQNTRIPPAEFPHEADDLR